MNNVLTDLYRDHANFNRLLIVLTEKLMILKEDKIPDFSLMLDIIEYLESYADLYHHPRENLIYAFHLNYSSEAKETKEAIDSLMQEHISLKDLTGQLHRAIDGILHGDIIPKERFVEKLSDFIEKQRDHLNTEEITVFPLLEKSLSNDDWKRIEKIMPARIDPLFGAKVERQYEALYKRII